MTNQSGGGGNGPAGGVLAGTYPNPTFATNGTTPILGVVSQILAAQVSMVNASQAYDGPSVALTAGTWLVIGTLSLGQSASGSSFMTVRLWDGTTTFVSTKVTVSASFNATLSVSYVVSVAGNTTVRLAAVSGQPGSSILATSGVAGEGNTASFITALRIA